MDNTPHMREPLLDMSEYDPLQPWHQAMAAVGAFDNRYNDDVPSWRRLSQLSGVSTTTLRNTALGVTTPSPDTVHKIATALRVTPEQVSHWIKATKQVHAPYQPPPESALMDARQRAAVTELIRAMTTTETSTTHDDTTTITQLHRTRRDTMQQIQDQAAYHPNPD